MRVRDPIHGTIFVSDAEVALVDSPFFQRLRHVKQLGFGELAFPGATHTRHSHSLGAMHVASRLFDATFAQVELTSADKAALRQILRVATLLHDLGHLPLSHSSEHSAPLRRDLGLPSWLGDSDGRASHEDFTARLLIDSSLTRDLTASLSGTGFDATSVVALLTGRAPPHGSPFVRGGRDFAPVLHQLVSGELDADRMDYLLRDGFYSGVKYGTYDLDWIAQNLSAADIGGRMHLALSRSAVFAFEDFLLSRYHMFLSVYYHHTAVCFDELLRRYFIEAQGEFEIPSEPELFLACDDVALWHALRASRSRWAYRLTRRRPSNMRLPGTAADRGYDLDATARACEAADIECLRLTSTGTLSKYFGDTSHGPELYVRDFQSGRLTPIVEYTPLYQRYADAVRLDRLYVDEARGDDARAIVARING